MAASGNGKRPARGRKPAATSRGNGKRARANVEGPLVGALHEIALERMSGYPEWVAKATPAERKRLWTKVLEWIDAHGQEEREREREAIAREKRAFVREHDRKMRELEREQRKLDRRQRRTNVRTVLLTMKTLSAHRDALRSFRRKSKDRGVDSLCREVDDAVILLEKGLAAARKYDERWTQAMLYIAVRDLLAPVIKSRRAGVPYVEAQLQGMARLASMMAIFRAVRPRERGRIDGTPAAITPAQILEAIDLSHLEWKPSANDVDRQSGPVMIASMAVASLLKVTRSAVNKWKPLPAHEPFLRHMVDMLASSTEPIAWKNGVGGALSVLRCTESRRDGLRQSWLNMANDDAPKSTDVAAAPPASRGDALREGDDRCVGERLTPRPRSARRSP